MLTSLQRICSEFLFPFHCDGFRGCWSSEIGTCKSCSTFHCIVLLCSGRCNQVWKTIKAIFSVDGGEVSMCHPYRNKNLFIENVCMFVTSDLSDVTRVQPFIICCSHSTFYIRSIRVLWQRREQSETCI